MTGNLSKPRALAGLRQLGIEPAGLPCDLAAAYVGLGTDTFLAAVADKRMPAPQTFGRRKVWARAALDRALAGDAPSPETGDSIMDMINAARAAKVR